VVLQVPWVGRCEDGQQGTRYAPRLRRSSPARRVQDDAADGRGAQSLPSREKAESAFGSGCPMSVPRTGPGGCTLRSSNLAAEPASGKRTPVPWGCRGGVDACGLPTPGDSLPAGRDFKRKDEAWCGGSFGRALGMEGRPGHSILAETCLVAGFVARAHAISMPVPHVVFVGISLVLDWVLGPRPLRRRPDHEHPVNEC